MVDQNFQDGDLQKVQSWQVQPKVMQHENMFEEVNLDWGTSLDAMLDWIDWAAAGWDAATPEGWETPPVVEGAPWEPADWEEVPADAPVAPEGTPEEWADTEVDDPILKELLDKIDAASQSTEEAQWALDTAIQWGDQADIQAKFQEFTTALAEKDRQIEILTKQVENEKGQADRFLNDKFVAESDGREKWKIYEAVMENPVLKDIVIYSMNATDNPQYQARLKDATKKLYEETHGVSVDDILNQNRVSEKQWLWDGNFQTDGISNPDKWLLWGMFEALPE